MPALAGRGVFDFVRRDAFVAAFYSSDLNSSALTAFIFGIVSVSLTEAEGGDKRAALFPSPSAASGDGKRKRINLIQSIRPAGKAWRGFSPNQPSVNDISPLIFTPASRANSAQRLPESSNNCAVAFCFPLNNRTFSHWYVNCECGSFNYLRRHLCPAVTM
jgi:hypothetical protein